MTKKTIKTATAYTIGQTKRRVVDESLDTLNKALKELGCHLDPIDRSLDALGDAIKELGRHHGETTGLMTRKLLPYKDYEDAQKEIGKTYTKILEVAREIGLRRRWLQPAA